MKASPARPLTPLAWSTYVLDVNVDFPQHIFPSGEHFCLKLKTKARPVPQLHASHFPTAVSGV